MSIALLANVLTIILCMAVLVQSVRMMKSLRTVKDGALTQVVEALQRATTEARSVLSDMKQTLGTDCARHAQLVERARELRDELGLMTGIADAAAERIVRAVGMANAAGNAGEGREEDAETGTEVADAPMANAA